MISMPLLSKATFSKRFPSILKRSRNFSVFRSVQTLKAPFSRRINMEGRPDCRNKSAFSYFSGLGWTGPGLTWSFQISYSEMFCPFAIRCITRNLHVWKSTKSLPFHNNDTSLIVKNSPPRFSKTFLTPTEATKRATKVIKERELISH